MLTYLRSSTLARLRLATTSPFLWQKLKTDFEGLCCIILILIICEQSCLHRITEMLIRLPALLAIVLPCVIADVEFSAPAPGASVLAGSIITAVWQDSKIAPALTSLAGYTILLMVGGDTDALSVGFQHCLIWFRVLPRCF